MQWSRHEFAQGNTHHGAFSSTLERDRFCMGSQHGVIKVAKRNVPRGGVSFDAGAVAAGVEGDVGALDLSSALLMPWELMRPTQCG